MVLTQREMDDYVSTHNPDQISRVTEYSKGHSRPVTRTRTTGRGLFWQTWEYYEDGEWTSPIIEYKFWILADGTKLAQKETVGWI